MCSPLPLTFYYRWDTLSAADPGPLFEGPYLLGVAGNQTFDVSPDGQRFLMIREDQTTSNQAQLVVVQNWFEELQRLVPVD